MSLDPDMHFGRPSSTAVRRLDLPRLVSTHHQYPRTPSPLPAPLQHNCASHYPANELTAHENIFRIYHRTLQPPATAQSRFTLQLPSPYHPNRSPVRPPPLFNSRTYASTAHPAVLYTHQNTKIQCNLGSSSPSKPPQKGKHQRGQNQVDKTGRKSCWLWHFNYHHVHIITDCTVT